MLAENGDDCRRPASPQLTILEQAVAFARGVDGFMLPAPVMADSSHAVALLVYGALIQAADDCGETRPKLVLRAFWGTFKGGLRASRKLTDAGVAGARRLAPAAVQPANHHAVSLNCDKPPIRAAARPAWGPEAKGRG